MKNIKVLKIPQQSRSNVFLNRILYFHSFFHFDIQDLIFDIFAFGTSGVRNDVADLITRSSVTIPTAIWIVIVYLDLLNRQLQPEKINIK